MTDHWDELPKELTTERPQTIHVDSIDGTPLVTPQSHTVAGKPYPILAQITHTGGTWYKIGLGERYGWVKTGEGIAFR